jgi:hypothetical protein
MSEEPKNPRISGLPMVNLGDCIFISHHLAEVIKSTPEPYDLQVLIHDEIIKYVRANYMYDKDDTKIKDLGVEYDT